MSKMIIKQIGKIKEEYGDIIIIQNENEGFIRIKQPSIFAQIDDVIDMEYKSIKKLITILKKVK